MDKKIKKDPVYITVKSLLFVCIPVDVGLVISYIIMTIRDHTFNFFSCMLSLSISIIICYMVWFYKTNFS